MQHNKEVVLSRDLTLDRFRGIAVFCMIVFQFLNNYPQLGFLARLANHNVNTGIKLFSSFMLADIILPMFLLAVAVSYIPSFFRYAQKYGERRAYMRFVTRYLSIIGIGSLLTASESWLSSVVDDKVLSGFEWVLVVLVFCALATGILAICAKFCKCSKFNRITEYSFLICLSLAGVATLGFGVYNFGAIVAGAEGELGYWVTLQTIGMAGLVMLLTVKSNKWARLFYGLLILTITQIFAAAGNQSLIDIVADGGFIGGLNVGAYVILASVVAEAFRDNKKQFFVFVPCFLVAGIILTVFYPPVLGQANASYLLSSLAISAIILWLIGLVKGFEPRFRPIVWWGANALLMFVFEFFILGSLGMFLPDTVVGDQTPIWLAIVMTLGVIALFSTVNWLLYRKGKFIKL